MSTKTQKLKDQFKADPVGFSKEFLLKLVESELNLDKETLTKLKDLNVDVNDIKETFKKLATSRLVMRKVCRVVSRSGIKHAKGWSKNAWELLSGGHNLHALSLKFGAAEGDGTDIPSPTPFSGHEGTGHGTEDATAGAEGGAPDDVLSPNGETTIDVPEVPHNPFEDIEKGFHVPHIEVPEMSDIPDIDTGESVAEIGNSVIKIITENFE